MPKARDLTISHVNFDEIEEMVLDTSEHSLVREVSYKVNHGTFPWVIERPDRGTKIYERKCPFCGKSLRVEVLSRTSETKERLLDALLRSAICVLFLGGALALTIKLIGNSNVLAIAGLSVVVTGIGYCVVSALLRKRQHVREKGSWLDHNIGPKWKFWQSSLSKLHRNKYGRAPYKLMREELKLDSNGS
jgi:hypothetical protein